MSITLPELVYFGAAWQLLQGTADKPAIALGNGWSNAQVIRTADGDFFAGIVEKKDAAGNVTDVTLAFAGAQGVPDLIQGELVNNNIVGDEPREAAALYEKIWNDPRYANAKIHVTGHSLGAGYTEFVAAESLATHGAAATDARADFTGFGVPNWGKQVSDYFGLADNALDGHFIGYSAANDPTIEGGTVSGTQVLLPAFWNATGVNAALDLVAAHWPTTYISALGLPDWLSASQQQAIVSNIGGQFATGDSVGPDYGSPGSTPLVIRGSSANDTLAGMAGNDTIIGGAGVDTMTGGGGHDSFVFETLGDMGTTQATADRITDWTAGDTIDLSHLDANTQLLGNQDFTFIGGAAFTGAGQVRSWTSGGTTWVAGNVDGNLGADFLIRLDGAHALTAQDFALNTDGPLASLVHSIAVQSPLVGSLV